EAGRVTAQSVITHLLQQRFVDGGHAPEDRELAAILPILLQELEAVRTGKPDEQAIDIRFDLSNVAAVVGRVERRPQLLYHLAAGVLEGALEAGIELVAIGKIVRDHGSALVAELLRGIVAHRIAALRRGRRGAAEPGI